MGVETELGDGKAGLEHDGRMVVSLKIGTKGRAQSLALTNAAKVSAPLCFWRVVILVVTPSTLRPHAFVIRACPLLCSENTLCGPCEGM